MKKLTAALCVVFALACDSAAVRAEREQTVALAAMDSSAATARRATATPSTGLWTEEHLVERLVRAGVAPRRATDSPPGPEWMGVARLLFLAGGSEVHVWIYADSTDRRAVTDGLESLTAAPADETGPYAPPFLLVSQNNLAAVIVGGSETNHDRIALALQAGLPKTNTVPSTDPLQKND